ncbi:MAG TPA: hypothetical protein VGE51_07565 [Fontimonas sp.]
MEKLIFVSARHVGQFRLVAVPTRRNEIYRRDGKRWVNSPGQIVIERRHHSLTAKRANIVRRPLFYRVIDMARAFALDECAAVDAAHLIGTYLTRHSIGTKSRKKHRPGAKINILALSGDEVAAYTI